MIVLVALTVPEVTEAAKINERDLKTPATTLSQHQSMPDEFKSNQGGTSELPQTTQHNEIKIFGKKISLRGALAIWIIILLSALVIYVWRVLRAQHGQNKKPEEVKK